MSINQKSRDVVLSAQQLLGDLMQDVQSRDPEMAQAVAFAVNNGERFELSVLFDLPKPRITVACVNGQGERKTVSTVKLETPAAH